MRATDTHTYDGQLASRRREIEKLLTEASSKTREEKLSILTKLSNHLRASPCFSPNSNANLGTIIRDFEQNNAAPNYDPSNNLFAIDLLLLCADLCFSTSKEVSDEATTLINIQLDEMSSGMCPPGRTTRLMQVVSSFAEYLEK